MDNMGNEKDLQKDLITVAVEAALLEMGPPELQKVEFRLKNDYNCQIEDCLDHPEYLKRILCDLFGYCYNDILATITKVLEGDNIEGQVEEFLTVLKS